MSIRSKSENGWEQALVLSHANREVLASILALRGEARGLRGDWREAEVDCRATQEKSTTRNPPNLFRCLVSSLQTNSFKKDQRFVQEN